MANPKKFVVSCDDREKRPIVFPKVYALGGTLHLIEPQKKRMKVGDYADPSDVVGIERKSALSELFDCFYGGKRRSCRRQLENLSKKYDVGILLVETQPHEVIAHDFTKDYRGACQIEAKAGLGHVIVQNIVSDAVEFGLHLVWCGRVDTTARRTSLGALVLSWLYYGRYWAERGKKLKRACK
jgi:ERCC4-type nuclease